MTPEREKELVEAVAREFEKRGPSVTQHTYWMIDLAKAAIDTLRAMGALAEPPTAGTLWRHKKTGEIYAIFALCQIESTNEPGILYHSINEHGPLWFLPAEEFMGGRFEPHFHHKGAN